MAMFVVGGCNKAPAKGSELNERQKRALATAAILKYANGMELDVLGGDESAGELQEMLKRDWDITDHKSTLDTIQSLKEHGHREEFNLMQKEIAKLDSQQYIQLVNSYAKQPEVQHQLRLVYGYNSRAGKNSILAWDYCRMVFLAECAFKAGYITEDEAWKVINPAAKLLQTTFASWDEMAQNYMLGRDFWSNSRDFHALKIMAASKFLLTGQKSPWLKLAWNMPLNETAVK